MELKLATMDIGQTPKKITLDGLYEQISSTNKDSIFYYFNRENSHKELQKAKTFLESKGKKVYIDEVHYGLDPKDFIYEFHIVSKID